MTWTIHNGDCLEVLRTLPAASVDAVVTDPPYGLSFMGKRWDYDVPAVEVWQECLRVLKPGGHLLAFAGTRTQHRMAVRIEDAGFEIRDLIAWVYGSGFPKSLDVSKAIDKAAGAEREVVGQRRQRANNVSTSSAPMNASIGEVEFITAPATDAARQWHGWGTALKPALEPITVARKPLASACINVLEMVECQLRDRGVTGDIQWKQENASGVAKSKITSNSGSTKLSEPSVTFAKIVAGNETQKTGLQTLKNSEMHGINGAKQIQEDNENFPDHPTANLEKPSSEHMGGGASAAVKLNSTSLPLTTSTEAERRTEKPPTGKYMPNSGEKDSQADTESFVGIATGLIGFMETVHIKRDSKGVFLWPTGLPRSVPSKSLTVAANVLEHGTGAINVDACRVGADGGTTRSEQAPYADSGWRTGHKVEPLNAGRWPANLIHDGSDEVTELLSDSARFFYCAKASKRDRDEGLEGFGEKPSYMVENGSKTSGLNGERYERTTTHQNNHPTVKPTDLMRYLCRLVTPPNGTILDPFTGSGSTGKAAMLEGFQFIGIERESEYCEIARARISKAERDVSKELL
jgi:DNA modification methylase